jgi:small subunit ribosomal protein S11
MAEEENTTPEAPDEKPAAAEAAPAEEKPAVEKPAVEAAAAEDKPAEDKSAEDKSAEDKPAEDKPAEDKPAKDKPAKDKPAKDKPAKDKPAKDKPAKDKPAKETPQAGDQPAKEKSGAEKPAAEGDAKPESKEGEGGEEGGKKKEEKKDIFAEIMGEEAAVAVKMHKAKKSKNVIKGIVHVAATFNNTMVTITDVNGNSIGWSSSGKMGFKGSRKSTAYAAQVVSQDACRQAMAHGLKEVEIRVKGPGAGREAAVRAVQAIGIEVSNIKDVTPIPHNGCRPKKARRV